MEAISAQNLEEVLTALDAQLVAANAQAHLVVVGGSGLVAIGAVQRSTRDVDVVAIRSGGELMSAEPLPAAVRAAAGLVARDFGLPDGWLNAGPAELLGGLPSGFASRSITRAYGSALRVDFASRIDQIHLKLYAWATRFEPRDHDDLRALEPSSEELRAAARWARTLTVPGPFDGELGRALSAFGVEDEGRSA